MNLGSGASRHVLRSVSVHIVDVQLAIRAYPRLCVPHDHALSLSASHLDRGRPTVAARAAKETGLIGFALHAIRIGDVGVEAARWVPWLQVCVRRTLSRAPGCRGQHREHEGRAARGVERRTAGSME